MTLREDGKLKSKLLGLVTRRDAEFVDHNSVVVSAPSMQEMCFGVLKGLGFVRFIGSGVEGSEFRL